MEMGAQEEKEANQARNINHSLSLTSAGDFQGHRSHFGIVLIRHKGAGGLTGSLTKGCLLGSMYSQALRLHGCACGF